MNQRLYRSRDDRIIAGVAGGVADYLNLDPSLVRIVWVILTVFTGGLLLLLYIIMLIVVPEEPYDWSLGAAPVPPPPPVVPGWVAPGAGGPAEARPTETGEAAAQGEEMAPITAVPPERPVPEQPSVAGPEPGQPPAAQPGAWMPPEAQPSAAAPPSASVDWRSAREMERAARRAERAARRAERDGLGAVIFGLILILVGGFFLVRMYVPSIDAVRTWPILVVVVGVVLVLASFRPRSGSSQT